MRAQIWEGPRRGQRPRSEGGHYQWLGNTTSVDDDAHGFYDRSLGAVENSLAAGKPYQLARADNVTLGGGRTGSLRASYDDAGSMTGLTVRRDGPCLPVGASCSQHYGYQWDEVGRLVRARRWDLSGADANAYLATPPAAGSDAVATTHGPAQADLGYAYDAGDQRRLKRAVDEEGEASHTVYVFPSLELRSTSFGPGAAEGEADDYVRTEWTETVYLFANGVRLARLAWEEELPTLTGSKLHVFLELGDHLGSTAAVLDLDTSELVERTTYLAYGGTESDYRPARWGAFREDYRFTGKEEDTEVGLTYFGKRFLSASLGRWMSADPLAVHAPGQADLNLYAYVSAAVLKAVDPVGLRPEHIDPPPLTEESAEVAAQAADELTTLSFWQGAGKATANWFVDTTTEVCLVMAGPGDPVEAKNTELRKELREANATVRQTVAENAKFEKPASGPEASGFEAAEVGIIIAEVAAALYSLGAAVKGVLRGIAPRAGLAAPAAEGGMRPGPVFAGHGSIGSGEVVVPDGTALTLWGRHGYAISDGFGVNVESGAAHLSIGSVELEGSATFLPGARVPNYVLHPGPDLSILPSSTTVSSPTTLETLLQPNMGVCQWAACRGSMYPPPGG